MFDKHGRVSRWEGCLGVAKGGKLVVTESLNLRVRIGEEKKKVKIVSAIYS